jgi:membrane-associated HD superfamily phosphohydrolase
MDKGSSKKSAAPKTGQKINLNPETSGEATDAGSMDKIRDILFGNQAREYEKRFSRMEEKLFKEIAELDGANQSRLEALEAYFKKELTVLKERLRNEIEERADTEKKTMEKFNDAISSQERKIAKLEETITAHLTDLHDQLLLQSKNLTADMDRKIDNFSKNIKETVQELSDIKADRSVLAELYMQSAMHLSGEQIHETGTTQKK